MIVGVDFPGDELLRLQGYATVMETRPDWVIRAACTDYLKRQASSENYLAALEASRAPGQETAVPADLSSVVLRPLPARRIVPGMRLLSYQYSGERDELVPVIATVTRIRRMFWHGPVAGYSYTYPGGYGEAGGGIEAVIAVEDPDPGPWAGT